ncbi:MAG: hypothetical protein Q7O66_20590 [Dehalococcoidia bacterium]|nr:hypothetical protein [Dehalococcoidia bacterium]
MAVNDIELAIIKAIGANKEAFAEGFVVAAQLSIPPDFSERTCDDLVSRGYLEAVGGRKKYRLGKEAASVLKGNS